MESFLIRVVAAVIYWLLLSQIIRGKSRNDPSVNGHALASWLSAISIITVPDGLHRSTADLLAATAVNIVVSYSVAFLIGYLWRKISNDRASQPVVQQIASRVTSEKKAQPVSGAGETAVKHDGVPDIAHQEKNATPSVDDEHLWEIAADELDSNSRRTGLWAMCFAASGGDENKARAEYLTRRVAELLVEAEAPQLKAQHEVVEDAELAAFGLSFPTKCPQCGGAIRTTTEVCNHCNVRLDGRYDQKPDEKSNHQLEQENRTPESGFGWGWLIVGTLGIVMIVVMVISNVNTSSPSSTSSSQALSFSSPQQSQQSVQSTIQPNVPYQSSLFTNAEIEKVIYDAFVGNRTWVQMFVDDMRRNPQPTKGAVAWARYLNDAGLNAFKGGDYLVAASLFLDGANADPSDAEIINNYAFALLRAGKYVESVAALEKTLSFAPNRPSAWFNLYDDLIYLNAEQALVCGALLLGLKFVSVPERSLQYLDEQASKEMDQIIKLRRNDTLSCARSRMAALGI